jgi:phosphoesterase RecJ-like protein
MPEQFLSFLLSKQRICLTTHARPDGDAIGSQLALGLFLAKLGKEVDMINSDPVPTNLSWMPATDQILVFDKSIDHRQRFARAEAIVILDANALHRLGDVARSVEDSLARMFVFDVLTGPEQWWADRFARGGAEACG